MNSITDLLDLEYTGIIFSNIQILRQTKNINLETPPTVHFCPSYGFRMHFHNVKKRMIKHPILQELQYAINPTGIHRKRAQIYSLDFSHKLNPNTKNLLSYSSILFPKAFTPTSEKLLVP